MLTAAAFCCEGNQALTRTNMDRRKFSKIHTWVLYLVAALAGCSSSSDADQISAQARIIASCSNSARMALVEWDLMQLPDAYVQRTLQSMERNVEVAASKIEAVRGLDAKAREVTRSASDILDILRQARNQVAQGVGTPTKRRRS
ncbi:hypothetical protein [Rhizobium redzepovicii]|uniref:hypothetical protein n=1 Tax=Rhizobium redzepovicii TaxID=2867518 RepID=UPI002871CBDC|nr:hypothetical protein [Rhizobium redzepovicii]MDR9780927.1 hypothetical protein [Rhizobium redzepovicii]